MAKKPLVSVQVDLSTVRGLYVILSELMERHADTPIGFNGKSGFSEIGNLTLWDGVYEVDPDCPIAFTLGNGDKIPDELCESPSLLQKHHF